MGLREFVVTGESLATMLGRVMPHLDERQRRIVAGATVRLVGRGGIAAVAEAAGMSRSTVQKATGEIDAGVEPRGRVRAPGAGRPRVIDVQPGLLLALDDLVEGPRIFRTRNPLRFSLEARDLGV